MGFQVLKSLMKSHNLLLLALICSVSSVNGRVRLEDAEQLQIDQYDINSYETVKKDLSQSSMETIPRSTEVEYDSSVENDNSLTPNKSPGYRTFTLQRTIPDITRNFDDKQVDQKYHDISFPGNEDLLTRRRFKRDTKNAAINAQMDAQDGDDSTVVKPEAGPLGSGLTADAPSALETGVVGTHGEALNPEVAAPDASLIGPLISAVIPNDTCMTIDDIKARGKLMGLPKTRKCPKHFPCQRRQSCRIWQTGLVHRKFNLDLDHANQYYSDLFLYLNEARMKEALDTFNWCVKAYYLEQPFMGDPTEVGETYRYKSDGSGLLDKVNPVHEHEPDEPEGAHEEDPVHGHEAAGAETPAAPASRRRRSPEDIELLTEHESYSHFTLEGMTPEPPYDYTAGVRNCAIRMDDFMECFEMILLKAVCYWMPPDSFATA